MVTDADVHGGIQDKEIMAVAKQGLERDINDAKEDQRKTGEMWETTQETLRKDLGGATTRLQAVQDTLEKALAGTRAQKTLVRVC